VVGLLYLQLPVKPRVRMMGTMASMLLLLLAMVMGILALQLLVLGLPYQ
jgi:hypothetical protein